METYSFEFPPQNEIFKFIFSKKAQLQVRGGKFKEYNAKNRIEKSSFFNEISLEYKAKKLPLDYIETKESQISLTEDLNAFKLYMHAL